MNGDEYGRLNIACGMKLAIRGPSPSPAPASTISVSSSSGYTL